MAEWLESVANGMTNLELAPFAAAAAALTYLLGVATGWLFWSGRDAELEENDEAGDLHAEVAGPGFGAADPVVEAISRPSAAGERLAALEGELKSAHALLAQTTEQSGVYDVRLDELDNALKRANGRLKLLVDAIDGEQAR